MGRNGTAGCPPCSSLTGGYLHRFLAFSISFFRKTGDRDVLNEVLRGLKQLSFTAPGSCPQNEGEDGVKVWANLEQAQTCQKVWYDKAARQRNLQPGQKAGALL